MVALAGGAFFTPDFDFSITSSNLCSLPELSVACSASLTLKSSQLEMTAAVQDFFLSSQAPAISTIWACQICSAKRLTLISSLIMSSFQSQNCYLHSETSSLPCKPRLRNVWRQQKRVSTLWRCRRKLVAANSEMGFAMQDFISRSGAS